MKARVIATGKIVEVVANENYYDTIDNKERYYSYELDFNDTHDYWTRLEHQAAISAMGGMCGNTKYNDYAWVDMAKFAIEAAHALVEKMKEK